MREKLANAIEESLLFTPDTAGVLMGVHAGIKRRRRRQRQYRIAGAIVLVVLTVVTSVLVAALTREPPPAKPRPGNEWPSTLQVGWLPDGVHLTTHTSTQAFEQLSYQEPGDSMHVTVDVDNIDLSDRINGSTMHRIEINGRPALEPTSEDGFDGYVNWQLPSGRWASVRVDAGHYRQVPYQAFATRVAESVRETREVVRTGFVPTYLPAGERIIGVSMDSLATGRGEIICASGPLGLRSEDARFEGVAGGLPADLGLNISISIIPEVPAYLSNPERIADIQGRQAYWYPNPGMVLVKDYHRGWLQVAALRSDAKDPRNALPRAELVKVTEGVRWVG